MVLFCCFYQITTDNNLRHVSKQQTCSLAIKVTTYCRKNVYHPTTRSDRIVVRSEFEINSVKNRATVNET